MQALLVDPSNGLVDPHQRPRGPLVVYALKDTH